MLKTYDFKLVTLIIGGITVTGYDEDGGISIEPNSEHAEASPGADGQYTISRTNDKGYTVTITLRETSRGYALLSRLKTAQDALPAIAAQPFLMIDPISGERVSDEWSAFLTAPTIEKVKIASAREFKLLLPSPTVKGAPNYTVI